MHRKRRHSSQFGASEVQNHVPVRNTGIVVFRPMGNEPEFFIEPNRIPLRAENGPSDLSVGQVFKDMAHQLCPYAGPARPPENRDALDLRGCPERLHAQRGHRSESVGRKPMKAIGVQAVDLVGTADALLIDEDPGSDFDRGSEVGDPFDLHPGFVASIAGLSANAASQAVRAGRAGRQSRSPCRKSR